MVVHLFAVRLVERWVRTGDARIAELVDASRAKGEEERRTLWKQAIDSLQQQISDVEVRVWWLNQLGGSIAEEIGVPPQKFFPGSGFPLLGGEYFQDSSFQNDRSENAISHLSSWVAVLNRQSREMTQGFDSMRLYAGRYSMLRNTVPQERPIAGKSRRTSGFGYRRDPFTGRKTFHSGYDFAAQRGTRILAGADGMVVYLGRLGNYGKTIELYHGKGISTLYGHLSDYRVELGDFVSKNDVIGIIGSTGRSTGLHLHYEIRVDGRPRQYSKTIDKILRDRGLAGRT